MHLKPAQTLRFRVLVTMAMRMILVRDGIAMRTSGQTSSDAGPNSQRRHTVRSGSRSLDARLVLAIGTVQASILVLHGIGERLEYWRSAQEFLADQGIASLIIDYSGYGDSEGSVTPANLREDAIAGYAELGRLLPEIRPPFVLGLSLGTGIAVDATPYLHPPPSGVVLCEAFTSLRDAASAVCSVLPLLRPFSRWLPKMVPDLYRTAFSMKGLSVPVLLVHSDADELFPVEMAQEIFAAASRGPKCFVRLATVNGYRHNEMYLRPSPGYWQPILDFIHRASRCSGTHLEEAPKR